MANPEPGDALFVMVVEDHVPDFELVANELRRSGLDARCKRVETLDEYESELQNEPDIILADYALPGFDALHALERLQATGKDIPFIVVTGTSTEDRVVECMKRGAADYLLKDRLARLDPAVKRSLEERDMRRQKRETEAELSRSNERFQQLVETTKAIPWELDLNTGRFTYIGPQAARLLGHSLENGYDPGFWDSHLHTENRSLPALVREAADPSADHEFTCRLFTRDGAAKYFHCVVNPPDHSAGLLRGFMMDITELETARRALARKTEDLARSNEELKQFAYIASHDLQEPLRMVSFYTQLLAKRYQGKLDSDADEFIGYAVEGATRMSTLIKHLLDYSRTSARKPELAPIDCEEIYRESMANLRLALDESGGTVTHEALPRVTGDAMQLGQVLQNLIGNAIKFHGDGPPSIHVSVREEPAEWRFAVRDDGIGIETQHLETIFTIFQRLHRPDEYPGSGVGLATCKRIMDHLRGRIWAESEPGGGSTFYFTIPKNPGDLQ